MPTPFSDISRCLWPQACPNCGHSLEGSSSEGTCPECGRKYDQEEVVLYGHARGTHENIANAKGSRIAWLFISSATVIFFQGWQFVIFARGRWWRWLFAAFAIAAFFAGLRMLRRKESGHPGRVQVRLNPPGCVQYDDLGGPSVFREFWRLNLWWVPIVVAVMAFVAERKDWINPFLFWLLISSVLVALPLCWRSSRRFRIAVRQLDAGAIADWNSAVIQTTSWNRVVDFNFKRTGDNLYRLSINAYHGFFSFRSRTPTDAELMCRPDQILELQILIRRWMTEYRLFQGG